MMKAVYLSLLLLFPTLGAIAQNAPQRSGSMAVSPARFELEMMRGSETTVVISLDYRAGDDSKQPVRIVASLNDWTITKDGRVEYFKANTRENSASPWLIYTPGEGSVVPGTIHQIRVTVSVPMNTTPGDHLTALLIEQRPDSPKNDGNLRQMIVRYRMASVFYIKVPSLSKKGRVDNLYAESTPDGIFVTPTLTNSGNSMLRPTASVKIFDNDGKLAAEVAEDESFPILAGATLQRPQKLDKDLAPGIYTVKYRIDFQDGGKVIEGIADLLVKPRSEIASSARVKPNP